MRAIKVYEAMNFERGKDPKMTLNIGLTARRKFDTIEELVEWMFRFPEVFSEGEIREWDYKVEIKEYGPEYYVVSYPQLKKDMLEYVKWIKMNIKKSDGNDWGLKESKDAFNSLERFLIYKSGNRVHESVSFHRGQDPKTSIGIGLIDQFIERLQRVRHIKIRFYNYAGMPGGQFIVPPESLSGRKPWQEEMKDIFGEGYIKRIGNGWPQNWFFAEIQPKYVDLYKEAWERVFGK